MPPYKAILLDAYDTLWYVKKSSAQIWHELLPDLGVSRSLEEILSAEQRERAWFRGQMTALQEAFETSSSPNDVSPIRDFWEEYDFRILNQLGLSFDQDTVRTQILPRFIEMVGLFPETEESLKTLRSLDYRIAIVSNGVNQEDHASWLGIAEYFDAIIGSLHVGYRKPMPEIFHMVLSELDVSPDQAIMIGDNLDLDVAAPQEVGIKGVHMNRGNEPSPAADSITDLWGLFNLLQRSAEERR